MARLPWWQASVAAACWVVPSAGTTQSDAELAEICSGTRLPFESPAFERFDRNGDERLTPDEAAECDTLEAVYSRLDLDADRALTRAEYRSFADTWRRRARSFGDEAP